MYNLRKGMQPDYSKMSLKEELETRFALMEEQEKKKKQEQCLISQPDYGKMSLREELETRFAEMERQEQEQRQTLLSGQSKINGQSYLPRPQMLPQTKRDEMEEFKEIARKLGYGVKGAITGAYAAGKDMANQLYQGGEALGEGLATLVGENYKYYTEPANKYPPKWGQKSEAMLNNFVENKYISYPKKYQTYPILAPIHDLYRNYQAMKNSDIIGADRFFHCAGAYDATKHGILGEKIGQIANFVREVPFGVVQYGVEDSATDWGADERGRIGAKRGLSLLDACPRNPREYLR